MNLQDVASTISSNCSSPSYVQSRLSVAICDYLEDVEPGEIERLTISTPPRHCKIDAREPGVAGMGAQTQSEIVDRPRENETMETGTGRLREFGAPL
jgi:hypothetical protein